MALGTRLSRFLPELPRSEPPLVVCINFRSVVTIPRDSAAVSAAGARLSQTGA